MGVQYTNELTPVVLAELAQSPFTAAQLAEMDAESRAIVAEQEAFNRQHPVNAIYRIATGGSFTQRGGVVREKDCTGQIQVRAGQWSGIALVGDQVDYPDGSTARISTGAGKKWIIRDRGVALVGSSLDNGDVIISTPQDSCYLVTRVGVPEGGDFLAVCGE